MRVHLRPYSLPFVRPLRTARGLIQHRSGLLVGLEEQGHIGWGDCAPLPGFSPETLEEATDALQHWRAGQPLPRCASAQHALSQASLQLRSSREGKPMWELLGGPGQPVPLSALVADETQALAAVQGGFRCVKVKVGARSIEDEIDRLRQIRTQIGGAVRLRVDANRAWSFQQAAAFIHAATPLQLSCIEEPLHEPTPQRLAQLRGPIPIAADESVRSLDDLTQIIAHSAVDIVVIKPAFIGALPLAREMVLHAQAAGLQVFITTVLESAIGRWGAFHLAASCSNLLPCGLNTGSWLATDLADDLDIHEGAAWPTRGNVVPC